MGSWITISNVVSPFLSYCDRFLIGSLLSVTAVAYYTTPQDAITKLLVLPAAIVSVLFPFIAGGYSTNRTDCIARAQAIFTQTFVLMFPVIALVVVFARHGMTLWLGADFAGRSYQVLQLFAIGVLINALAQVPATILQAIGKPRWAATLHVVELLLYVPASYLAVTRFGLIGAALVWGGRIAFDAVALVWAVERAWVVKPLLRAKDLLLKLVFAGTLATYVAFGHNRFPLGFLLVILALFSITYRANIVAPLRGAIARYGLTRSEADPSP
jgi:O-antigen/teichoic acid export membrane protein